MRGGTNGRWRRGAPVAALVAVLGAGPAPTVHAATPAPGDAGAAGVQRIDDYKAAVAAARESRAMLLVSVEPRSGLADDAVGCRLENPDVAGRFASSETPWVFCRIGMDGDGTRLASDPGLGEMRGGPGVFVVDHAHPEWDGRIVSVLPRAPGTDYRFAPHHLDELAALPPGSLTQRSMVLAVRIHPERPQSTSGACDPVLCREAAAHSGHQARIRRQGHHGWGTRSQRIVGALGGAGSASEVCAESWEHQDLLDSCVDCVASWRQSGGHWRSVSSPQAAYGYDIRRGGNGIWYATGVFLSR